MFKNNQKMCKLYELKKKIQSFKVGPNKKKK